VQREHGDEWQRQHADLRAELADRVGHEQLPEVVVAKQAELHAGSVID
jgi:hypothetical protein